MEIDKQCFTKIVKNDFEVIGKYIVLPIVALIMLICVCSTVSIDFNTIRNFISNNLPILSIILFDVGLLLLLRDVFKTFDDTMCYILITSSLITLGCCGILITISNYIPHVINIIFLLITIPLMHGYIKCKKV